MKKHLQNKIESFNFASRIPLKIIRLLLLLIFVAFYSCEESTNPNSYQDPPTAIIDVNTISGSAPLNVTFTDASDGEITSRVWRLHDGQTRTNRTFSLAYGTVGSYTVSLTVKGPGGEDTETVTIDVYDPPQEIRLSDVQITIDNTNDYVKLTIDVQFIGYAGEQKVLGLYWRRAASGGYDWPRTSCGTNTPNDELGYLYELKPSSNASTFNNVGQGLKFYYTCFPNRSPGTTYYPYIVVYDRSFIVQVTGPNDQSLTTLGPILSKGITW